MLKARRIELAQASFFVTFLSIESYLIKVFYSPLYLKFPDELLHLQGTVNALSTGRAGASNPGLPISSNFPGLQAVSASLAASTGLSPDAVGFILSGLFHLGFLLVLLLFFLEFNASPRFALIAIMIYACNNGFLFFNSMYLYENLALPFMVLALYFARRMQRPANHPRLILAGAYLSVVLTVVSHHITAIFLSVLLVAVLLLELRSRSRERIRPLFFLTVFSALLTSLWFVILSPSIFGYISPYTVHLTGNSAGDSYVYNPVAATVLHRPLIDQLFGRSSVLLLGLLVLAFGYLIWRGLRRRSDGEGADPWNLVMFVCALGLFGASAAALVSARGGEIASRLATFSYIGVAVVVAVVLHRMLARTGRWVLPVILVLGTYAYLGAVSNGWPPWWDRLPGTLVGRGNESGVDGHTLKAAQWVSKNVPTGSRFAADANGTTVLASYGHQLLSSGSVAMFYESTAAGIAGNVESSHTQYVWVDTRLPRLPSSDGLYFYSHDGPTFVHPPSVAQLALFDSVPGANLIYSDGSIKIYDVRNVT